MNILLTGASGFLGSALALHWMARGHRLLALTRAGSSLHRLGTSQRGLTTVVTETPEQIARAFADFAPDAVVHTACAYGRAGETPLQLFQANLGLGMALVQASLDSGRRVRFVNTGTVLESRVSLYALSKNQFSDWGARLARQRCDALQFIDVKLQHMFGPGDDSSKFISHVLRSCARHEPELRLTLGTQKRDFIYIADVVAAYDTLLQQAEQLADTEAIEVGSGLSPTVREVVETIHRLTGSRSHLAFGAVAYRPDEAMHCVADTRRLAAMGWQPAYDLQAGLRETLQKEFGT